MTSSSFSSGPSESHLARERVLADLKLLAADAEALLLATADDASEVALAMRARITQAVERMQVVYEEVKAEGLVSAAQVVEEADEKIRSAPYQSIAIAFGVGVLVGAIVKK